MIIKVSLNIFICDSNKYPFILDILFIHVYKTLTTIFLFNNIILHGPEYTINNYSIV